MSGSSPAVEVSGLGKRYRSGTSERWAVRGLDLVVPVGMIYGLLGRNGAGKSTVLRSLVGLVRPDEGTIRILGKTSPDELPTVIGGLGVLLDGPSLDGSFSVRRNLQILARLRRIPPGRIDEVLDIVDLTERADDVLSSYSLGMRQRAGLAAAMLSDPDVLILDEPTNGLDPAGIAATRELLLRLRAERGTTILLSSHQLGEVGQLCDRVAIMHGGRVRADGSPALLSGGAVLESVFLELTND